MYFPTPFIQKFSSFSLIDNVEALLPRTLQNMVKLCCVYQGTVKTCLRMTAFPCFLMKEGTLCAYQAGTTTRKPNFLFNFSLYFPFKNQHVCLLFKWLINAFSVLSFSSELQPLPKWHEVLIFSYIYWSLSAFYTHTQVHFYSYNPPLKFE